MGVFFSHVVFDHFHDTLQPIVGRMAARSSCHANGSLTVTNSGNNGMVECRLGWITADEAQRPWKLSVTNRCTRMLSVAETGVQASVVTMGRLVASRSPISGATVEDNVVLATDASMSSRGWFDGCSRMHGGPRRGDVQNLRPQQVHPAMRRKYHRSASGE